jgi:hypothetical protein
MHVTAERMKSHRPSEVAPRRNGNRRIVRSAKEEIPVGENENETRNIRAVQPPRGRILPHIPARWSYYKYILSRIWGV